MILSILIPTLINRKHFLKEMLTNLFTQRVGFEDKVQILTLTDSGQKTTGHKRNLLLKAAKGKYVWFVDDDDYIFPGSLELILKSTEKNPDVIPIDGVMTTDGQNPVEWEMRIGHPYKAVQRNGKEFYLRHPNHIAVIKRELALKVSFPLKNQGEDYQWACDIQPLLKTQEVLPQKVYHYKFRKK